MVSEFFLNIIFALVTGILNSFKLADFAWGVTAETLQPFLDIVKSICYFLPMETISVIVGLVIWFGIFRIVIRLIKTLWDLLPLV